MTRSPASSLLTAACIAGALLLAACSPKFDWREVRGANAPFAVMLPAKPASHTRDIDLDGIKVAMTMTATEVDGVTFAVGSVELPDAPQAQKAALAMRTALTRNIGGTARHQKTTLLGNIPVFEIEAIGPPAAGTNRPRLLLARFLAHGNRAYQLVVVGDEDAVARDTADVFFSSFKLQ